MAGFLDKLISIFSGANDPEAAKKHRIKQLVRDMAHNKYARFYRAKTGEIDGSLGKLFYDIYKVVCPAQVFLQNAAKSAQLKQIVVEAFFDKELEEIKNRLTPEAIEEKAKTGLKELSKSLNDDFAVLDAALDSDRIAAIDRCYDNILAMVQFVTFDFFFFLKKFDSKITERSFSYQPVFSPVRGEYLKNELRDFLDVSFGIDPDQDWKKALAAVKTYKNGVDVVAADQWNKLLALLRDIKKSGMIDLMIRHIEQKPDWIFKPRLIDEHIAENYLGAKRAEIKTAIDKVVKARNNARVDALAKVVFGSTEINRVKYYTEKNSELYIKKGFDGYIYTSGVNYLKAFLLDYLKKDLRELYDLLLIRGQWANPELSRQTSDHLHKLMDISDTLISFDESMSDTADNGSRLKTAIAKADRDKSQARYITMILKTVNEKALEMIKAGALSFTVLGKTLKALSDDIQKPSHELLINWKELEGVSETPLSQRIADAYKKVYYFIQILQAYSDVPGEKAVSS
jgi:hypothetical protein